MKNIFRPTLAATLVSAAASTCWASNLPLDDLLSLSIEELAKLEITSSTRTTKLLKSVPASVTVFSKNELQNMGIDFLHELLNFVPGFQTSRDGDAGTSYLYSSRGSDTGQHTSAILLLVDGIPRQEVRTSSASNLSSFMPLERIKRVEVMRGPGSALYGSNAFLGVINIITVDQQNTAQMQVGQPGRQQAQIQASTESGDWHADAFLYRYQDDGQNYLLNDRLGDELKPTQDPQTIENATLRVKYKDTQFAVERINFESEDFYSVSVISNDFNRLQHYLNQYSAQQAFQMGSIQSTIQLSYGDEQRNYASQGSNPGALASISAPSSAEALYGDVLYQASTYFIQWLNDWHASDSTSLQFGLEWKKDDLNTARVIANYDTSMLANRQYPVTSSTAIDIYNEVIETDERETTSLYGQVQHLWTPDTEVIFGLRYDNYSSFDDHVSPRLAIVHQLSDQSSVKLLFGEAYRAPSFLQLFVKENITVARNPDLKAETIRTSELIWLTQREKTSFTIGAFYNEIQDRIDSSTFSGGKRANINKETEYSAGIEFEAMMQFSREWLVRASYTYFSTLPDASYRESDQLASIIVNYKRDKLSVNLAGYYNNERMMPPADSGETIPAFTLWHTKIGYQTSPRTQVNLKVKNLLDEDAGSSPQNVNVDNPIPYRGREISAGFTYTF